MNADGATTLPVTAVGPGWIEWEPDAAAAWSALLLFAGRGERAGLYSNFAVRLRDAGVAVRVLDDASADPAAAEQAAEDVQQRWPGLPLVLGGHDTGALLALHVLRALDTRRSPAGVVLAGTAAGVGVGADWPDELRSRTACTVHGGLLSDPALLDRGALAAAPPAALTALRPTAPLGVPTLLLHGAADTVVPLSTVTEFFQHLDGATLLAVIGGRHDVLNDHHHSQTDRAVLAFIRSLAHRARSAPSPGPATIHV